jgi:hypothetical protein
VLTANKIPMAYCGLLQVGLDGVKRNNLHMAGDTPAKQLWRQWKAARQAAATRQFGRGAGDSDRFVVLFAGGKVLLPKRAAEATRDDAEPQVADQQAAEQQAVDEDLGDKQAVEQQGAEDQVGFRPPCCASAAA